MKLTPIAALYVQANGCYFGLDGVDPWGEQRDARAYAGTMPVVAHPPCERWGRYWSGGPSAKVRRKKGDDNGCFKHALTVVLKKGGVLEHPEASHAWAHFGIPKPRKSGGWVDGGYPGAFTCCVEQGHYGHKARKATWLFAVGCVLPELKWGPSEGMRMDEGFHSAEERKAVRAAGVKPLKRLSKRQRAATPIPFRDMLIAMARSAA